MLGLALFGGVAITKVANTQPIDVVLQPKVTALLTYLVVAGTERSVRRDLLLALLWPQFNEQRARADLRQALHRVRLTLGDGVIETAGPDQIRLRGAGVKCDVWEFERAAARGESLWAVTVYRGPLLAGFHFPDAPEFERWLETRQDGYARLYARALEDLATAATQGRDHAEAVELWGRLLEHDPYNSRAVLELMQSLVAHGDPANALMAAMQHRACLQRDLEVDLPPELWNMVATIRDRLSRSRQLPARPWRAPWRSESRT